MTSSKKEMIPVSDALLRLTSRQARDPALANAYEAGDTPTRPITCVRVPRFVSRHLPRQRPRSPDRQASRDRRRMLGGSSALPDNLRCHYTEGQRSVLCIIAGEVKRKGCCDLPIDKIGALAGVCRTTVQTTLHEARRLGHIKITERPRVGQKSLTNLIVIASMEWQAWMKRGPSAAHRIGSKPVNWLSTTKSREERKIAGEWVRSAGQRRSEPIGSGESKPSHRGRQ